MTERKYSVREIDKMRAALRYKLSPGPMVAYDRERNERLIEEQLRTHMLASSDPDELVESCGGTISGGGGFSGSWDSYGSSFGGGGGGGAPSGGGGHGC